MDWMGSECGMDAGEQRFIVRFGGETWKKRQFRRARRTWKGNIKLDLQRIAWGADWIWIKTGTNGQP
jgi:hypothetical protein